MIYDDIKIPQKPVSVETIFKPYKKYFEFLRGAKNCENKLKNDTPNVKTIKGCLDALKNSRIFNSAEFSVRKEGRKSQQFRCRLMKEQCVPNDDQKI